MSCVNYVVGRPTGFRWQCTVALYTVNEFLLKWGALEVMGPPTTSRPLPDHRRWHGCHPPAVCPGWPGAGGACWGQAWGALRHAELPGL